MTSDDGVDTMNERKMERDSEDLMERRLRGEGPIADDGFTAQVMRRLPAESRPVPRNAVVVCALAVGTALVLLSPASPRLLELVVALQTKGLGGSAAVALLCMVAVLVGSGVQAAFE